MVFAGKKIRGTREWAVANIDCCTGCSHNCRYCYARYDSVIKKQTVSAADWSKPQIRKNDTDKDFPLYPGTVMFPANHDILPEILDDCIYLLGNLLDTGNTVLIVSKPHRECIVKICQIFKNKKEQILFRFSITAQKNHILKFWEPGAPTYAERLDCLRLAFQEGFQTSVSIEPMLDSEGVIELVEELSPFVTHSIWIGKMNRIDKRVDCNSCEMEKELKRIRDGQSDSKIKEIFDKLRHNNLIRWKESVKEVVGLDLAQQPGLDI